MGKTGENSSMEADEASTLLIREILSSKKTSRKRGKLEVSMEAAMPCKVRKTMCKETCAGPEVKKSKSACIVDANESTRKRLEGTQHKNHEDHIGDQAFNSPSHYNLVHKFIPMPQALKIPEAKAGSVQRMGKARENASMASDESQEQKRGHPGGTKRRKNSPLRCTHGHLSSQEFIVGTTISKVQRPGGNSERRFRLLRSIHRARFVCITNDGRKSYGCDCGATRMCRKSSRRSISVYLGQNGRCTSSIENYWVRMS